MFNDPRQFLHHYYHLVAELLFGAWAIWTGSFTESSYDAVFQYADVYSPPPKVDRMIFVHSDADGWRDSPGFDAYFLRAAFPSATIEHAEDWQDRVTMSTTNTSHDDFYSATHQRAWHFPLVLLADRSGAFRGQSCGSRTQRTASEAWEAMITRGQLPGLAVGGWWSPIRKAVWKFAGVQLDASLQPASKQAALAEALRVGGPEAMILPMTQLPAPETIVITYISRQAGNRRKLIDEDHEGLVSALQELVDRKGKGWEFQLLEAEKMTKDSQVRAVSRSTVGCSAMSASLYSWFPVDYAWSAWERTHAPRSDAPVAAVHCYRDILPRRLCPRLSVDNNCSWNDAFLSLERYVRLLPHSYNEIRVPTTL